MNVHHSAQTWVIVSIVFTAEQIAGTDAAGGAAQAPPRRAVERPPLALQLQPQRQRLLLTLCQPVRVSGFQEDCIPHVSLPHCDVCWACCVRYMAHSRFSLDSLI